MPGEPDLPGAAGEQRELLARLRAVVEARDAENAMLRAELAAALERQRRLELRVAELERRLGQDSGNSGMPTSKEPIGAKERRKAERRQRQESERERRKDRKRGGHPGAGLSRDPDPDERKSAEPPVQCSRCGTGLDGAEPAKQGWQAPRAGRPFHRRIGLTATAERAAASMWEAEYPAAGCYPHHGVIPAGHEGKHRCAMTIQPVTRGKSHGCAPHRALTPPAISRGHRLEGGTAWPDVRKAHPGGRGPGGRARACALAIMTAAAVALMCGCGAAQAPVGATPKSGNAVTPAVTLPPGVMPATQACRLVTGREPRGFFTHIEQVHLVLTTYAKGEPIESQGDISAGMAPHTLVWVVEVHARAIHWNHSAPALAPSTATAQAQAVPAYTDYSVVINARTGYGSDAGECNCWPLPLRQAGTLISLPAGC